MSIRKAVCCLIAMLLVWASAVSNAMAGAYDTGDGHGYASCASTTIMYKGAIMRISWLPINAPLLLCNKSDQLQRPMLFRRAFRLVALCLQGGVA